MGFIAKSAEHLDLLNDMVEKTNTNLATDLSEHGASQIRNAIIACLGCRHVDSCKKWLDQAEVGSAPPSFCANARRFSSLSG